LPSKDPVFFYLLFLTSKGTINYYFFGARVVVFTELQLKRKEKEFMLSIHTFEYFLMVKM